MKQPKPVKILEGRSCWDVMTLWPDATLQARFIKDGGQGVEVGEGFTKEEIIQWVQERPKMFTLVDQVEGEATQ